MAKKKRPLHLSWVALKKKHQKDLDISQFVKKKNLGPLLDKYEKCLGAWYNLADKPSDDDKKLRKAVSKAESRVSDAAAVAYQVVRDYIGVLKGVIRNETGAMKDAASKYIAELEVYEEELDSAARGRSFFGRVTLDEEWNERYEKNSR